MGVEQLRAALARQRRIALDTSIFIYHLEANPKYLAFTDCIFAWLDSRSSIAVTSVLTMTELLVKPYREADTESADKCYTLLSTYPNLVWISPTLEIAYLAGQIRAIHRLRMPDALRAATSIHHEATAFLTNDPVFGRVPELGAIVLDRFL